VNSNRSGSSISPSLPVTSPSSSLDSSSVKLSS
jgi:hypothetical protein